MEYMKQEDIGQNHIFIYCPCCGEKGGRYRTMLKPHLVWKFLILELSPCSWLQGGASEVCGNSIYSPLNFECILYRYIKTLLITLAGSVRGFGPQINTVAVPTNPISEALLRK